MEAAAVIAMVNALTGVITQLLFQAKRDGVNVDDLLAKYDEAHVAAMAYEPIPRPSAPSAPSAP